MKKILLSFSVITLFVLYSLHQSGEGSNVAVTPLPAQSLITTTPTSLPTPSSASATGDLPPTSAPIMVATDTPTPSHAGSQYKDGQYTGDVADAYYGNVQVQVAISGGKITDVIFLDYPHDRRTSQMINSQAMPYLKQEAIQAQTSQVDVVSGATATSGAFVTSLESALAKARA